jgi:putative flippase GtrA
MRMFANRSVTRHDVIQFLKFMVGGTMYFWSGYAVFAFCYSVLGWDWLPAKIAADIIGWTLNYLVQRYWAFSNATLNRHEERTLGRYSLIILFNLGLDYVIIAGLKALGVSPYIGFFISAAFFTVWNYAWYRFYVFFVKPTTKGGNV